MFAKIERLLRDITFFVLDVLISGAITCIFQKLEVVAVPKPQYGNFYKGDSYIVLSVSKIPPHFQTLNLLQGV